MAHTVILVVILGATAFWISFALSKEVAPLPGMSITEQRVYIAAHPLAYCKAIAKTLWIGYGFYYESLVGVLGWLTLYLPWIVYILAASALLLSILAQPADAPRLPAYAVVWNLCLLTGSTLLIMTSTYLISNQVGSQIVVGVQGRYFIPLLPLFIATAVTTVRPLRQTSRLVLSVLVPAAIAVNLLIANMTIVRAYRIF